jgi:prefoldin subunit 5
MNEQLNRLEAKIDKITDKLHAVDVTLATNTSSLVEHVKRCDLLEEKMVPVEKHVWMVNGALKLIGLASILVGIVVGLVKLFS